jgi:hypothetical protein
VGCYRGSINDYTTLKQKALEIPPDFELVPPKDKQFAIEVESDEALNEIDSKEYDIESLLSKSLENSNDNTSVDTNNENQNSEDKQKSIEEFISDQIETAENDDQIVEEDVIINDDNVNLNEDVKTQNLINENEDAEIIDENSDDLDPPSEEKFLEELSDVEEIIALPEDEQLQSQRSTGSKFESDEFLSTEDLNDLLDRVDRLFEDQLN